MEGPEMPGTTRQVGARRLVKRAGFILGGVTLLLMPVVAQNAQDTQKPRDWSRIAGNFGEVRVLPDGGPAPRTADGHPDLTGRYYPVFRPETKDKYQFPTPYGICPPGGTPTSITTQATEHGPMELVQRPGALWILTEFPQTIRWIPTDGRPHSKNPDPSFNGESIGTWEGDTLVVDTIAIDERMRNISVGRSGDANAWTHSKEEHVIERFTRKSKNYLIYQLTVIDPIVLVKPFTSAPLTWTLAQNPNDAWTEYHCTANEEPFHYENMSPEWKKQYETQQQQQQPAR